MKVNKKLCIMTKKVINRGKRIKTLNEVKAVENISKNPQILVPYKRKPFLHINCKTMHMINRILLD